MIGGPMPEVTPVNQLFWDGTAAGELRIRCCKACGARFRFTTEWCPTCWSTDLGWETTRGQGTVRSFTVVHMAPYESMAARVPYVLALVELAEGPTMICNIVDCAASQVRIGIPVQVTFEARGDLHIPQFKLT